MSVPRSITSSVVGHSSWRISPVPRMRLPRQRPFTSSTPLKSLACLPRSPSMPSIAPPFAGMSPPPRRIRVAEQDEERASDVDETLVSLRGFRQDGQIAILRDGADHARQGRHLAEPDGVKVFERVEIDDHAALAFCDLARQQPVPIAGARDALNVDRPHAVLLLHPGQIVGAVARVDYVLGDAALTEMLRLRFDLDEVGGSPAVYDFAFAVLALSRRVDGRGVA